MKILLDMDGVLCAYYEAVMRALAADYLTPAPWPYPKRAVNVWNWFSLWGVKESDVAPMMNRRFYASLDWTADGREILTECERMVGADNVYLLTSPWDTDGCIEGKRDWVRLHAPAYLRRMMIGSPKELCSRPDHVLIDDSETNCRKFAAAPKGGTAVLVPRPWNVRHDECCLETGRVKDLQGLFHGYGDGRPRLLDDYLARKQTSADPV